MIREQLAAEGWALFPTSVRSADIAQLRHDAFDTNAAGTRCLLDQPAVLAAARQLKEDLVKADILPSEAVAIQAIAFDKTPGTNWKVAWHQDLMFPLARAAALPDYAVPSLKQGVDYARLPLPVLEELLAVRLHLDDCGADKGPLRVAPGTHLRGIIASDQAAAIAASAGQIAGLATKGEAILMRPLLLHASSQASAPASRRVLHFVFHSGQPVAEPWHRSIA